MEYAYAVLILNEAGAEINETNLKAVLTAAGEDVIESRVKALVAALEDVDINRIAEAGVDHDSQSIASTQPDTPEASADLDRGSNSADAAEETGGQFGSLPDLFNGGGSENGSERQTSENGTEEGM